MADHRPGRWRRLACALALGLGAAASARAQEAPKPPDKAPDTDERARRADDLKQVRDALAASHGNKASLEAELAAIGGDRAKLAASLLDAGRQAQATEDRLTRLDERLKMLREGEGAMRKSLEARRGLIAEILAALQRMGRRPPPAVLVRPEDVLAAIRTSMLLGAVVPELRGEAQTLTSDLTELIRVRGLIAADRESLRNDLATWAREKQRLDALIQARRTRLAEIERGLTSERQRSVELGQQARSLQDLVDRMEGEAASQQRAAAEARAAQEREAKSSAEREKAAQDRFAAAGIRDPARLAPKVRFVELRGEVPRPASGATLRAFNQPDGRGGTSRGVSVSTRPRAVVSSPADGWVSFAGPFRSYGQLLIINAGDGYYLLLAGMGRIDVEVGQFVLAGEPVAAMGESSPGASTGASTSASPRDDDRSDPVLYVEFRKDGGSIDPEPWWARGPSEKVRG